ncbi:MAG: zinc ABC transporter substrate-binding protein [Bacteroidales bacterium]
MKKNSIWLVSLVLIITSCGTPAGKKSDRVITVSIPPFEYFVKAIAGDDFKINVMLPPGADHHIWEPLPAQINELAGSEAFILNGQLGFEKAWMGRFSEINPDMKILDLSRHINLIKTDGSDFEGDVHGVKSHSQGGPDPHYWMSPISARIIAQDLKNFLTELNPGSSGKYETGLKMLDRKIAQVDSTLRASFSTATSKTFMIYHPALGYMARDYGLVQVAFEDEGKSPSPARMKELIDIARDKKISIIFIQAEYDVRNAKSLAGETGARLIVINPMNSDWPAAVMEVGDAMGRKGE